MSSNRNYSSREGCSCHLHPPCDYCVETQDCEQCGDRYDTDDLTEVRPDVFVCETCIEETAEYDNFGL